MRDLGVIRIGKIGCCPKSASAGLGIGQRLNGLGTWDLGGGLGSRNCVKQGWE